MSSEEIREPRLSYSIIQGTFRTEVDPDKPDAVRRDWKSADGKNSGTKYERIINALKGFIEKVDIIEGDYGKQVVVTLDKNSSGLNPTIYMNASSREGEDFMKKLPNINLMNEVRLRPYSFTGDDGDVVKGIDLTQTDEEGKYTLQIQSFFFDKENRKNLHGYPDPEGDTESFTSEDWKNYYYQARKFLMSYVVDVMAPKLAQAKMDRDTRSPKSLEQQERMMGSYPNAEDEGIDPNSIPF
jgi:hypothetical protein